MTLPPLSQLTIPQLQERVDYFAALYCARQDPAYLTLWRALLAEKQARLGTSEATP